MNDTYQIVERNPNGKQLLGRISDLIDLMKMIIEEQKDPKFPEVMTPKDVQGYLQISNQTFYNLKNDGIIRASNIGGLKRYLKSEINKVLIDHLN